MLEDIKKGLFAVLLPQHTKIKQQISEILDGDLIKQQAENGVLDFGVSWRCVGGRIWFNEVISALRPVCNFRDGEIMRACER